MINTQILEKDKAKTYQIPRQQPFKEKLLPNMYMYKTCIYTYILYIHVYTQKGKASLQLGRIYKNKLHRFHIQCMYNAYIHLREPSVCVMTYPNGDLSASPYPNGVGILLEREEGGDTV